MDYPISRKKMLEEQLIRRGIQDPRVLEVMGRIPRHEFVDRGLASQAYEDRPLQIGFKQTISQPFMVAYMTEQLRLSGDEKVLEIGTGCGYQTAVLCELSKEVFSVERIKDLSNRARKTLYRLGYINFELSIRDGTEGFLEKAPFDAILVTASSPSVPEPLRQQMAGGGRLIIPVGEGEEQKLIRIIKRRGEFLEESLLECRFVKLWGRHGWQEDSSS